MPRRKNTKNVQKQIEAKVANEIVRSEVNKVVKQVRQQPKKQQSLFRTAVTAGAGFVGDRFFGLGKQASRLASKGLDYIGVGDYVFADGTTQGKPPPVVIRNVEFVQNITGSIAFSNVSHAVNPSSTYLFPWLSGVALNYQKYRFKSLVFKYISSSGSAVSGTNPSIGSFNMGFNYDPAMPAFTDEVSAKSTNLCRSFAADAHVGYAGMECRPRDQAVSWYFVYTASTSAQDDKFLFPARFNYFTVGQPANGNQIGQLYVEYEIELTDPLKLNPANSADSDVWLIGPASTSGMSGSNSKISGNLSSSFTGATFNILANNPPGYYMVSAYYLLSSATSVTPTFTTSSNLVAYTTFAPYTTTAFVYSGSPGLSDTYKSWTYYCQKLDANAATLTIAYNGVLPIQNGTLVFTSLYVPSTVLTFQERLTQSVAEECRTRLLKDTVFLQDVLATTSASYRKYLQQVEERKEEEDPRDEHVRHGPEDLSFKEEDINFPKLVIAGAHQDTHLDRSVQDDSHDVIEH